MEINGPASIVFPPTRIPSKTPYLDAAVASERGIKDVEGKLRFDLIPPEAMVEIAKVFTGGALKYKSNYCIDTNSVIELVVSEVNKWLNAQYAGTESIRKVCAEVITRKNLEEIIQSLQKDSERIDVIGESVFLKRSKDRIWQDRPRSGLMRFYETACRYIKGKTGLDVSDLEKISLIKYGANKMASAEYVGGSLSTREEYILTTTMCLGSLEVYFAVSATMASDGLMIMLKELAKLLSISSILLPENISNDADDIIRITMTGDRNWEKGIPVDECVAAIERHLMRFKLGQDFNPKTECHEAAHMAFWCMVLISQFYKSIDKTVDDFRKNRNVEVDLLHTFMDA